MPEKIHKEYCCPTWWEDTCHCKETIESSHREYEWTRELLTHYKKQWDYKHKALLEAEEDLKLFERLFHEADKKLRKIDSIEKKLRQSRMHYAKSSDPNTMDVINACDECLEALKEFVLYE